MYIYVHIYVYPWAFHNTPLIVNTTAVLSLLIPVTVDVILPVVRKNDPWLHNRCQTQSCFYMNGYQIISSFLNYLELFIHFGNDYQNCNKSINYTNETTVFNKEALIHCPLLKFKINPFTCSNTQQGFYLKIQYKKCSHDQQ